MRLLFDHDVPDDAAYGLAEQGHEVLRLRDLIDPRTPDEEVLRFAGQNSYVLVTATATTFLKLPGPFLMRES